MQRNFNFKSLIAIFIFFIVSFNVATNISKWKKKEILQWDVCGYHNYLPAIFIYHDLDHFKYYDSIDLKYKPTFDYVKRYALYNIENTGKVCNQYPIGVAVFQTPFFLIAHAFSTYTHIYPSDGYSSPYQHATFLSTLFFVLLAYIILRRFLLFFFSDNVVAITLLIISVGTNLFNYIVNEPGLSHPYVFFLYAAILLLTYYWYQNANWKNSFLLGICIGMCAITRPLDALVFLVPLFWNRQTWVGYKNKIDYLSRNKRYIALAILAVLLTVFPQMLYWKHTTDHWIYYSYSKSDYFQFDRIRVLQGLFGFRKGWFLYSPLLLMGFIGSFFIYKNKRYLFYILPFWLFFIPMIYLVFSWHMWTYGWSLGCRALLETVPLLAFPMAILVQYFLGKNSKQKIIIFSIIILLSALSIFQTWQYMHNILKGDAMSMKYYFRMFGRTDVNDDDLKLIQEQRIIDAEEDL